MMKTVAIKEEVHTTLRLAAIYASESLTEFTEKAIVDRAKKFSSKGSKQALSDSKEACHVG
jgi:hypothetical protein